MYSSLTDAPAGLPLTVARIGKAELESQLGRMGIFVGSEVVRLDEDVALETVRVRGPRGEVVLGGGMGGKVVAHLDDGRMIPLTEMRPGERGHVECVNAGEPLREAMEVLGLRDDDPVELVRVLPPMEFTVLVSGRGRVRFAEGMAAKILGSTNGVECQFANARAGKDFLVSRILGGNRAQRAIRALGIRPGVTLRLESVAEAPSYHMAGGKRLVVSSNEGLRLFLRPDQTDLVTVSYDEDTESRP